MKIFVAAFAALAAACSPPAVEAPAPAETVAPAAPAADLGPYTNTWDASEFSRFRHALSAATPGTHTLTLRASTNSPGGETVAVYPIAPSGEPATERILFVIADTDGTSGEAQVEIPSGGLPVAVAVENASGRRFNGNYTITIAP
jgi:hypothetical protein